MNVPYMFKGTSSKRNSVLLRSFINQGRLTLVTGERLEVNPTPRQTLSQTVISPIYSSKCPFILPENHLLSPMWPTFLLPLLDEYSI